MEKQDAENRHNNLRTFEIIKTVQVPDEILCKYCANKLEPIRWNGKEMERHTNGHCKAYEWELKPHDVLWGESFECEYFDEA